jgi:Protein of unknown function (DUF3800)
MHLSPGGIDIFYIDESHDTKHYVVSAVCVPFLRQIGGIWQIVWPNYLEGAKRWRKEISVSLNIPRSKELHGVKLASCRGQFLHGRHNFKYRQASEAYSEILSLLSFLPDESLMSVATTKGSFLYGHDRLEAAMYALFQRMRRKCISDKTNAITFFDAGHPEYRKLYRMAQVHLTTGRQYGGMAQNMPLNMFTKDANEKNSKHCYFTQVADLVAYAAFLLIKSENGQLTEWQQQYNFHELYKKILNKKINQKVSKASPRDGIVRLLK